ncbi:hypothetical protein TESG_03182 [Trichophyton tonsurans CBS 112818]|uniref:Hydroxyneurosporene synthase n=1 Tax=Trichophyton tonsurans (strain CBS 112818) TaxID=647933 RepID=F2RW91_TRIT1|nr:hypothetical protein TESG_03182 [Trichophyton tonsurans CBS 112818]
MAVWICATDLRYNIQPATLWRSVTVISQIQGMNANAPILSSWIATVWLAACIRLSTEYRRDTQGSITVLDSTASLLPSKAQFLSGEGDFDSPKLNFVNETVYDWWYFDAVSDDGDSSITVCFFTSSSTAFPFLHLCRCLIINFSHIQVAPPHYPCSAASRNVDLQVCPHVGWANAIPDGNASVDMTIAGSRLRFHGSAYHDKNWSDVPFTSTTKTWYWGRTRIGPYSVVWFYVLTPQHTEHASAYIANKGKIRHAACAGAIVMPILNRNAPSATDTLPIGFRVEFNTPGEHSPLVNITIFNGLIIASAGPSYIRWIGNSTGCVMGDCGLQGFGTLEQFRL